MTREAFSSYIITPSPLFLLTPSQSKKALFSPSLQQLLYSSLSHKAMASHALALYNSSCSPYNLDGDLSFTLGDLEREESQSVSITPLTIMPPPVSYGLSEGDNLKSTAWTRPPHTDDKIKSAPPRRPTTGIIGIKRAAPDVSGPSKCLATTLSGSTSSRNTSSVQIARPSLSHTLVGIDLPNGGCGKGLMQKATLPKGPAETSSSAPLRIPRQNLRRAPNVFERKSETGAPLPKTPTLSFLNGRVDALTGIVERLESDLEKKETKNAQLVEDLNKLRLSFHTKLARIARAAGLEHALTLPK
jgi:hypothetical protein